MLNVSKEGFVSQSIPVTITADQVTTVNVVLLPSVNGLAGFLPLTAAAGILVALMVARKRLQGIKITVPAFSRSQEFTNPSFLLTGQKGHPVHPGFTQNLDRKNIPDTSSRLHCIRTSSPVSSARPLRRNSPWLFPPALWKNHNPRRACP